VGGRMEEAAGRDLAWFFRQWLHRPTSPSFEGGWRYDAASKRIEIELTQTQPGEAYRVPVEFGVDAPRTEAGQPAPPAPRIERVEMTDKHGVFTIASDTEPTSVTFDPNTWLLMDQVGFRRR